MKDLIEKLEKATGPDRELDREILRATDPEEYESAWWNARPDEDVSRYMGKDQQKQMATDNLLAPTYTASIDAVRSAFPFLCVFASDIGADGLALVTLVADTSTNPIVEYSGIHSRLEIAWLIAAMKAHASTTQIKAGE